MRHFVRFVILTAALAMLSGTLAAGENKLMHCFVFTPVESATQEQWDAFYKATNALPAQIPGLNRVWFGKLRRPLPILMSAPGGAATATAPVRVVRTFGVCMEFNDLDALNAYAKNPAHDEWVKAYSAVRQSPTTTFDILGQ